MKNRIKIWLSMALLLVVALAAAVPAGAGALPAAPMQGVGGGAGGDLLVSVPPLSQGAPAVAHNTDDDQHLVVWEAGGDVQGQIYSAQGLPLGENFQISFSTMYGVEPAVAYNSTQHEYMVVWEDARPFYYTDIYGQRVGADGSLIGSNFAVTTAWESQSYPTLAYNSIADEYLVVWQDRRNMTALYWWDIYGRLIDYDGTLLGTDDIEISTWAQDDVAPDVVYNRTEDQYLVVWEYWSDGETDIHAQLLTATGGSAAGYWIFGGSSSSQFAPAVAWDSVRNEYVIVWEDDEHEGTNLGMDIYATRCDAAGGQGYTDPIISDDVYDQTSPDVTYDEDTRQFLVVWRDERAITLTAADIYGQRVFNRNEGLLRANQGSFAISTVRHDQARPAVAYSSTSRQFLVAWEDGRNGEYSKVYAQRVWWPGLLLGDSFGIAAQVGSQTAPAIVQNTHEHETLVVWIGDPVENPGLYGQRYDRDGLPLDDPIAVLAGGNPTHPSLAYNDQENEYLVVWESSSLGIFAQRLSAQGALVGEAINANIVTGTREEPVVAYNPADNEYLVAYVYGGNPGQVYGTLLSADGRILHGDIAICSDDGAQDQIDVAHNGVDNYLVIWRSGKDDAGDIYARYVESDGDMPHTSFSIAMAGDAQAAPALAWNGEDGEFLAVWHDYRESWASGSDIWGQRLDASNGTVGGSFRISTVAGLYYEQNPDVAYVEPLDRYRVVWHDSREAAMDWDIRGQWVLPDGTVFGAFDDPVFRYPGAQQLPVLAYDANYEQAMVVWRDGRNGVKYDIYGRFGALDHTPPVAAFTRDPGDYGQVGTEFVFNAWASHDDIAPRGLLMTRWDLTDDPGWEVDWSLEKYVTWSETTPGTYTITLQVRDWASLTDTVSHQIEVQAAAQGGSASSITAVPPTATLTITPGWGVAGSSFSLDASGSSGQGTLVGRWDWENDGWFETAFDTDLTASHVYTVAGEHTARFELRDDTGLSASALYNVTVLPAAPVTLEVAPAEVKVVPNQVVRFRTTAWDMYDNVMYHPEVTWSLADPAAGTLSSSGVFTAGLEAGTYPDVVVVGANGLQDTASVTVFYPYGIFLPLVVRN